MTKALTTGKPGYDQGGDDTPRPSGVSGHIGPPPGFERVVLKTSDDSKINISFR